MKGDFSRQTFRRDKHYSGVLMQQGRVQLDADFNELGAITRYRDQTEAIDVIGQSGTPRAGTGFQIGIAANNEVRIGGGRYYVDGILCENDTSGSIPLHDQPDLQGENAFDLLTEANANAGLIYLDVWQRHVTALEDPLLREVALGGPDTATRLQTVWQVRALPLPSVNLPANVLSQLVGLVQQRQTLQNSNDPNAPAQLQEVNRQITQIMTERNLRCGAPFSERSQLRPLSTGLMNARTEAEDTTEDPCELPPTAGYQRLENQLYRVEIHTGGLTRATSTFKWSRENGSVVTRLRQPEGVNSVSGTRLEVDSLGRDASLGFKNGDWVEIVDDETERNGTPGRLARIQEIDAAGSAIILEADPGTIDLTLNPKLRRWDQVGLASEVGDGVEMTNTWISLEGGIQVMFSEGVYNTGDYWMIPARTATGEIEWSPYEIPNTSPQAQPPQGTRHHFCDLALILRSGNQLILLDDCRELFPALTDIRASDVSFDNTHCDMPGINTVQQALDELCERRHGACTVSLVPGDDIAAALSNIGDDQDAYICFQVGEYRINEPITLIGKGNLKVIGSGFGTRIIGTELEAAFIFENCEHVLVRDLHAETGVAGSGQGTPQQHLRGTLTFFNCAGVTVEEVSLRCAAGTRRAAACISVENTFQFADFDNTVGFARVRGCRLRVGDEQTGILLVNTPRSQVEDNVIQVTPKPASLNIGNLVATNKAVRTRIGRLLASNLRTEARPGTTTPGVTRSNNTITISAGNQAISFDTDPSVASSDVWENLVAANPPTNVATLNLVNYVRDLIDVQLTEAATVGANAVLAPWLTAVVNEDEAVMSQGIVIGGTETSDARILNNTVQGARQGIHVGASRREDSRGTPILAQNVLINNNNLDIWLPPTGVRERHGIFVGNCNSLVIESNMVSLRTFTTTQNQRIEGIRVYGHLGKRMIIRQNHITPNFTIGIYVNPINTVSTPLWIIHDNAALVQVQGGKISGVRLARNYA
jgi:hypothetical protein